MAQAGRWKSYDAGQFVYMAGDAADGLYGLAAGTLEVTFPLIASEPVSLYRAAAGFWIGDSAEFADIPRLVSLMAATECRLLHLPSGAVHALLARQPEHWRSFYRLSHVNVALAINLLAESLSLSVRARVCRRLLSLTAASEETAITQEQLAKTLGLARSTVRNQIADLEARGALETGYGKTKVLNRPLLESYRDEQ